MELSDEEKEAIEYLKENSLVRIENEKIVAYGNSYKLIVLNLIEKQQKEIEKEKERNALLLANNNGYFELKKYIKNNYISKDKIREIIEDIEGDIDYLTHDLYEDLKKLLGE